MMKCTKYQLTTLLEYLEILTFVHISQVTQNVIYKHMPHPSVELH